MPQIPPVNAEKTATKIVLLHFNRSRSIHIATEKIMLIDIKSATKPHTTIISLSNPFFFDSIFFRLPSFDGIILPHVMYH